VVLAARGYRVIALERSPLVAALLADGLARSGDHAVLGRIELVVGDALNLIPTLPLADIILLDPMFPERGKSALKDKGMRALRALVGDDPDASALLALARRHVGRRVVVKRPLAAEPLAGPAPSGAILGTTVRFDIYPPLR
jgi:16S rRNA (guanine1516-N2)-methyltransferase